MVTVQGTVRRVVLPGGIELHAVEHGRGPPLLLLHGGMGDSESWAAQWAAFTAGYRVIAYSRRHSHPNRNPLQPGHSIDVDVADLHALMQQLETGPAHVVGTSYGACVALRFAVQHCQQVRSLVLAEPPLHGWACRTSEGQALYAAFIDGAWRPAAEAFAQGHERRALQLLTDGMWGQALFDTLPAQRVSSALRNVPAMKAQLQAPVPFAAVSRSDASRLALPTLLVVGSLSSPLHRCVVQELARQMPAAQQVAIDGAGHGSPFENPQGFNRAVLAFLSRAGCAEVRPVRPA